tara:strand:+ start:543 stop:701 length:159 start_codon:yes stop_codon:yes gene_type:complete
MEIIPTRLYWNEHLLKLEIGVGKKKSVNDKRDDIQNRDGERQVRRIMKGGYD